MQQRLTLGDVPDTIALRFAWGAWWRCARPGLSAGWCRTLAQQFSAAFDAACRAFKFALGARAGMEAAACAVRALCEKDPRATVVSIDGVGAYDHFHRASVLRFLAPYSPSLRGEQRVAVVRCCGTARDIAQAEGGEQGDPIHANFLRARAAPGAAGGPPPCLERRSSLTSTKYMLCASRSGCCRSMRA